jgi:hypothetical protein
LNFQVPTRGIFGNISANLSITLTATNAKPDGIGGTPLSIEIPLTIPTVQFKINVTSEYLPKNSYYLAEYLEGNITLEFLNINDTLETNFPGRNITSILDIPTEDIDLVIFIDNSTSTEIDITQKFTYNIVNKSILWYDRIEPHILSGNYNFRIRWNTPFIQNITSFAELSIAPLLITIQGTLEVIPPTSIPIIIQGNQITINFTIQLAERDYQIGGLNLLASIAGNVSEGNLIVYEQQGLYFIILDIPVDMEPQTYEIDIYVLEQSAKIGSISFTVEEREIEETDEITPLDIGISIGGFAAFVLIAIIFLGLMLRVSKSS